MNSYALAHVFGAACSIWLGIAIGRIFFTGFQSKESDKPVRVLLGLTLGWWLCAISFILLLVRVAYSTVAVEPSEILALTLLLSTAFVFWCVFNGFFNRLMDRIEIVSGLDRPFKLVRTEKK